VEWDKGCALAHLLGALGLDAAPDVLPIYIGDDRTDEDAFRLLATRPAGFGILVSTRVRTFGLTKSLGARLGFGVLANAMTRDNMQGSQATGSHAGSPDTHKSVLLSRAQIACARLMTSTESLTALDPVLTVGLGGGPQ
jgi:hypothetical protein